MLPWNLEHRVFACDTDVKNGEKFYLWGCLKSCVYAGKPRTLGELKTAIRENIQEIGKETLVKVASNLCS